MMIVLKLNRYNKNAYFLSIIKSTRANTGIPKHVNTYIILTVYFWRIALNLENEEKRNEHKRKKGT